MTTAAPVERRARSQQAIQQLVNNRNEMLKLYNMLAAKRPFKQNKSVVTLLQNFCQSLIDYTAEAHFRLYQYIENQNERRQAVADLARDVYPRISDTTQQILDFNDKYDCEDHCDDLSQLEIELSQLGERLADRIELEDKLIDVMTSRR